MIRAAAVEPMPSRSNPLHVKAFIGELEGRKVTLEVYPETTARDVISAGLRNGDLAESQRGSSWVVVEIFAELGCGEYLPVHRLRRTPDPRVRTAASRGARLGRRRDVQLLHLSAQHRRDADIPESKC
jgi:hypothetical protein